MHIWSSCLDGKILCDWGSTVVYCSQYLFLQHPTSWHYLYHPYRLLFTVCCLRRNSWKLFINAVPSCESMNFHARNKEVLPFGSLWCSQRINSASHVSIFWVFKRLAEISVSCDGVLCFNDSIIILLSLRSAAVSALQSGHFGMEKIISWASLTHWWPAVNADLGHLAKR